MRAEVRTGGVGRLTHVEARDNMYIRCCTQLPEKSYQERMLFIYTRTVNLFAAAAAAAAVVLATAAAAVRITPSSHATPRAFTNRCRFSIRIPVQRLQGNDPFPPRAHMIHRRTKTARQPLRPPPRRIRLRPSLRNIAHWTRIILLPLARDGQRVMRPTSFLSTLRVNDTSCFARRYIFPTRCPTVFHRHPTERLRSIFLRDPW